ncbi:hypothetical protein MMC29_004663 [Sticta canariensis]|nr:hypothetical protein [Sticta canariensis]
MVSRPNKVVKRTSGNAERLAPSLHTLATEKALKILDDENEPLFVLDQAWRRNHLVNPDCTWEHMSLIVNAALDRMAVTYKSDPEAADKRYDSNNAARSKYDV